MTMMLIRVLGLASKGQVNPADILLVMAYFVLGHMPTILTLCLLIAVVHTLTRMYKDSEMVIWQTSGKGARSLISPVFGFAWPHCEQAMPAGQPLSWRGCWPAACHSAWKVCKVFYLFGCLRKSIGFAIQRGACLAPYSPPLWRGEGGSTTGCNFAKTGYEICS